MCSKLASQKKKLFLETAVRNDRNIAVKIAVSGP